MELKFQWAETTNTYVTGQETNSSTRKNEAGCVDRERSWAEYCFTEW